MHEFEASSVGGAAPPATHARRGTAHSEVAHASLCAAAGLLAGIRRMGRTTRAVGPRGVWRAALSGPWHIASAAVLAAGLLPVPARAHVKWFAEFDVSQPPVAVAGVLTPRFLLILVGFTLAVFGGFVLDRLAARSGHRLAGPGGFGEVEERLLRAGVGGFFVALFAAGDAILTPELRTTAGWVPWLQLAVAAGLVWRSTCVLSAIGVLALYAHGVSMYGVFHLSDYPLFLGIAAYLALTSARSEGLRSLRMPVLYAGVCASLMWASVEKWVYPHWMYPIIEAHSQLTMGIPPALFTVMAGFVEFALSFYILTGLGLLRLAVLALGLIMTAAILEFGKMDAIGHMPIIAALAVMFLHGPTRMHHWLHDAARGLVPEARRLSGVFVASIGLFVAAYYGLQYAEHGRAGTPALAARGAPPPRSEVPQAPPALQAATGPLRADGAVAALRQGPGPAPSH